MSVLKHLKLFVVLLFATFAYSSTASAACTPINSVPFAITSSGQYCLSNNVQTSGAAGIQISIGIGNVTLDLGGFSLKCMAAQNAIMTTTSVSNVIVENGTIRDCNYAVAINNCTSCSVRNIQAINNSIGIVASGFASRVENNQIRNDNASAGNPAILMDAYASLISSNHISGSSLGIMNRGKGNVIRANSFGQCGTAIRFDTRATYQDNLTQLCTTAFSGADLANSTDAGGNF
ncbi:NosD domain-containing protein [Undibacterium baiyunense]|uniref:Periplasmic copper-binding protein NosD beta helix domain-containing protein n=1 Tax=Undibacterium baiyunense TaxID=2828731 RepID=A0A941DC32_9BURK|nr:NosD domain-containing protein [Undibacterium baiyunense]MBR7745944.1 hypothetical protein [Undibacterium baiyunense]